MKGRTRAENLHEVDKYISSFLSSKLQKNEVTGLLESKFDGS